MGLKNFFGKQTFDAANFLMLSSAVGWAASSAAQVVALVINDKIPQKDKKFMVYQETMDAVVNISLFLILTNHFKNIGKNLVKKGILAPTKLAQHLKTVKPAERMDEIAKFYKNNPEGKMKFNQLASAVSTGLSLVGSIIGSNILTPFARNYIASKRSKNLKLGGPSEAPISKQTLTPKPVFHGNSVNSMESYLNSTRNYSSGMKI